MPLTGIYTVPTLNLPKLNGDYIISWWAKEVSGWVYNEKSIPNYIGSSGTPISTAAVNGYIDEVRLFLKGSLMTTYTYEPLVGMTSITDSNNVTGVL